MGTPATMSGQALEGWSSTRQQRGRLPDGAAGYLLQPARSYGGSLSSSQKAVGGSIPLGVDNYSPLQGKGSHGQSTGLSGKVLFWVALRLPYLLGTLCHHEGQATRWDSSTRGAAYLLQILRRVASAPGQRAGSILSLWVLLPEPTKGRLIYSLLGYI